MAHVQPNPNFGTYLRRRRERQGLSGRRCAAAAGIDSSYYSRLERGLHPRPDPRILRRLAKVLIVDAADMMAAAGYGSEGELPGFEVYMRTTHPELPDAAIAQIDGIVQLLHDQYHHEHGDM